jgi:hypothetical protein
MTELFHILSNSFFTNHPIIRRYTTVRATGIIRLWNSKVRYHVHKNHPLETIPSKINPFQSLTSYFIKTHYNTILLPIPVFPKWSRLSHAYCVEHYIQFHTSQQYVRIWMLPSRSSMKLTQTREGDHVYRLGLMAETEPSPRNFVSDKKKTRNSVKKVNHC